MLIPRKIVTIYKPLINITSASEVRIYQADHPFRGTVHVFAQFGDLATGISDLAADISDLDPHSCNSIFQIFI